MINSQIFRAYDIRGKYKTDLTAEIAYKIGFSLTKMSITNDNNLICVGMDGRVSSPELCAALTGGIKSAGGKVIFIGLVPTPALYYADKKFLPAASIMVTGSHNPKEDNGFKMIKNGKPFFGEMIQELSKEINQIEWKDITGSFTPEMVQDISDEYIARITEGVGSKKQLKIAFDPANGAACLYLHKLCHILPVKSIIINDTIDGTFPAHDPDPTVPKNLEQLKYAVLHNSCDIGIGFDGDADRIGVVTKQGNVIFGDQLLCLYAEEILANNPGASIIADVKASATLFDHVAKLGGKPIMWKTGHSFIKQKMQETNALLAGEMSGHIFFADKYYGYDDALYSAVRLISIIANSDQDIDQMIEKLPKAHSTPEMRINVPEKDKFRIIEEIKCQAQKDGLKFIDVDGLRVIDNNGWWLLRASNTQAAIIARCEANSLSNLNVLLENLEQILVKYGIVICK